jgi:hypothetical protein
MLAHGRYHDENQREIHRSKTMLSTDQSMMSERRLNTSSGLREVKPHVNHDEKPSTIDEKSAPPVNDGAALPIDRGKPHGVFYFLFPCDYRSIGRCLFRGMVGGYID